MNPFWAMAMQQQAAASPVAPTPAQAAPAMPQASPDMHLPYEDMIAVLQQQIADSRAKRQQRPQYKTGLGALLGGMGGVVGEVQGRREEGVLGQKQQALMQQAGQAGAKKQSFMQAIEEQKHKRALEMQLAEEARHEAMAERGDVRQHELTLKRDTIQNQAAEKRARIMAAREQQERATALANEARKAQVPGFNIKDGESPTPDDAKKMKESLAAAKRMSTYVEQLRQLHADHGTEYGGATGNQMDQLARKIELEAKNIGELGALAGPDLGLIQSLVKADPGSLKSNLKGLVSGGKWDSTQSDLDGVKKWVDDTLSAGAEARGYVPEAGGAPPPSPEDAKAVEWARANPGDPRAAAILKANGVR
jgi:hypothetical protein